MVTQRAVQWSICTQFFLDVLCFLGDFHRFGAALTRIVTAVARNLKGLYDLLNGQAPWMSNWCCAAVAAFLFLKLLTTCSACSMTIICSFESYSNRIDSVLMQGQWLFISSNLEENKRTSSQTSTGLVVTLKFQGLLNIWIKLSK